MKLALFIYTINMMGRARARIVNIKWFAACVLQGDMVVARALSGQKLYWAPFRFMPRPPVILWGLSRSGPVGSLPNSILRHPIPPLPLGSDVRNFSGFSWSPLSSSTRVYSHERRSRRSKRDPMVRISSETCMSSWPLILFWASRYDNMFSFLRASPSRDRKMHFPYCRCQW